MTKLGARPSEIYPPQPHISATTVLKHYFDLQNKPIKANLSDKLELEARALLLKTEPDYRNISNLLNRCLQEDPSRETRIRDEFGFFFISDPNQLEQISDNSEKQRTEWRRCVWKILEQNSKTKIKILKPVKKQPTATSPDNWASKFTQLTKPIDSPKPEQIEIIDKVEIEEKNIPVQVSQSNGILPKPSFQKKTKTPEQRGEQLEEAVLKLLESFFLLDDSLSAPIITKLRQQKRGTQFGHDISFEFQTVLTWNHNVRCHVECKNITNGNITISHVADKIARYEANDRDIHHWILISPHARPTNDLNQIIEAWKSKDRYRFTIQIWCPDNQVEDFFGLKPIVFDQIYGETHSSQPRNWSPRKRQEIFEKWRNNLAPPPLQLGDAWENYLRA